MTKYTKSIKTEKEKDDECFKEMKAEFDLETKRLIQETQKRQETQKTKKNTTWKGKILVIFQ